MKWKALFMSNFILTNVCRKISLFKKYFSELKFSSCDLENYWSKIKNKIVWFFSFFHSSIHFTKRFKLHIWKLSFKVRGDFHLIQWFMFVCFTARKNSQSLKLNFSFISITVLLSLSLSLPFSLLPGPFYFLLSVTHNAHLKKVFS